MFVEPAYASSAEYQDFCDRTSAVLWKGMEKATPAEQVSLRFRVAQVQMLRQLMGIMNGAVRPRVEAAFKTHPEAVGKGFARVGFRLAARECINFLGAYSAQDPQARAALKVLTQARQPLLADFAKARSGAPAASER